MHFHKTKIAYIRAVSVCLPLLNIKRKFFIKYNMTSNVMEGRMRQPFYSNDFLYFFPKSNFIKLFINNNIATVPLCKK